MAAPVVQNLEQILADLEPAYAPSRALYNQQISFIPTQTKAARAGLDVAKANSFRDINTQANSKGLAFSGIPTAEQTRYTGERYLPALADLENTAQTQTFTLQQALAGLEKEKYTRGLDTRTEQQKILDAYLEAERERAFKAQLQREQIAASRKASGGGGVRKGAASNEQTEFQNFIANKIRQAGGNILSIGRRTQDDWANEYFRIKGIGSPADRQPYWDFYNTAYGRNPDPRRG